MIIIVRIVCQMNSTKMLFLSGEGIDVLMISLTNPFRCTERRCRCDPFNHGVMWLTPDAFSH